MTKRVLITGGAGFIGSHVVEKFAEKMPWDFPGQGGEYLPYNVLVVDNLSSGKLDNIEDSLSYKHVGFVRVDILDYSKMETMFDSFRPEVVVHLAAQPSLLESQRDPIYDAEVNIIGTLNLAHLSAKKYVRRFVFASTSAAESAYGYYWTDKEAPPESPYGISKRAAEWYLGKVGHRTANSFSQPSVVILRLANVYGPQQVPLGENQLIPRSLAHIYRTEEQMVAKIHEFSVYSDGKQTRDFIYVGDVAEAIYKASIDHYDMGGLFNISTGKQTSVLDVLAIIKKATKFKGKWEVEGPHTSFEKRGRRFVEMPDNGFRREFDWEAETSLEDGIKKTVEAWPK